jgi:mannose/cellobiose epimerase-like protein (N-acyl-D-glucosamine 2-epimerase family)
MRRSESLDSAIEKFKTWFTHSAMPLWSVAGVDHEQGGFIEKLDGQGNPIDEPRRTRVVSRQLYVFSVAKKLGWAGDVTPIIEHGLAFLTGKLLQPDGTFASSVTPDGSVVNLTFDLYEQAFALFAMATVYRLDPSKYQNLLSTSESLLGALNTRWGHPIAGFEESQPRTLPLRANPHMHLFEAALQWAEAIPHGQSQWWSLADELAELALKHLIQPESGLLTECFDGDWQPMPGSLGTSVEPGHQFEWGWLLCRWGQLRKRTDAIAAARHMILQAEENGVDVKRRVVINEIGIDLVWRDPQAKIWPQTERIKAWSILSTYAEQNQDGIKIKQAINKTTESINCLMAYLDRPLKGVWYETQLADGDWSHEHTRASSFYHIVCALEALHDAGIAAV